MNDHIQNKYSATILAKSGIKHLDSSHNLTMQSLLSTQMSKLCNAININNTTVINITRINHSNSHQYKLH